MGKAFVDLGLSVEGAFCCTFNQVIDVWLFCVVDMYGMWVYGVCMCMYHVCC